MCEGLKNQFGNVFRIKKPSNSPMTTPKTIPRAFSFLSFRKNDLLRSFSSVLNFNKLQLPSMADWTDLSWYERVSSSSLFTMSNQYYKQSETPTYEFSSRAEAWQDYDYASDLSDSDLSDSDDFEFSYERSFDDEKKPRFFQGARNFVKHFNSGY